MNDINSLLDMTLDDIADLPEFKPFPAGVHRVTLRFTQKEINKHPAMEMTMRALETLELADPTSDTPLVAGTEASMAYHMDNEIGLGKLKKVLKELASASGETSVGGIIEAAQGVEVIVVTSKRTDKNEATKVYMDVKKVQVV